MPHGGIQIAEGTQLKLFELFATHFLAMPKWLRHGVVATVIIGAFYFLMARFIIPVGGDLFMLEGLKNDVTELSIKVRAVEESSKIHVNLMEDLILLKEITAAEVEFHEKNVQTIIDFLDAVEASGNTEINTKAFKRRVEEDEREFNKRLRERYTDMFEKMLKPEEKK
jgi:hypothetical protein